MIESENRISLETLDQHRDRFIDSFTHALRNQIAAIGGYADLIGGSGSLNEDQQLFLKRVQSGAERLNHMLPSLIDLAWLEAEIPFPKQHLALDQIVTSAAANLEIQAGLKGIRITHSIAEPPPLIAGDAMRLKQALIEVIRNALCYSPSGNSVTIKLWHDEKAIYCSIADQGIGISAMDQELVFDRLFRSSDPRVRSIEGSGLGLTLANRIVRAHNGELKVASQLNQGSIFTISLPLNYDSLNR